MRIMKPNQYLHLALACLLASVCVSCVTSNNGAAVVSVAANGPGPAPSASDSVVQVTVTEQGHDFLRPWQKRPPASRRGLGVAIAGDRVLVTATLVQNATFVELQHAKSGGQTVADVTHVDYQANLAVLTPHDPKFLSSCTPLEINDHLQVGDRVSAWQLEANGSEFVTEGELRSVAVGLYPYETGMLAYRIEISLSRLTSSYTIPVVNGRRLAGLLMHYSANTRIMTLVPAPVIKHFLDDLDDGKYEGFPLAGFSFTSLVDAQLRRHVSLPDGANGVYVSRVRVGSPAEDAGIRAGDVLAAIGEHLVDKRGEYDDPTYGKLGIANIPSMGSAGDVVPFHLLRDGKPFEALVTLRVLPMNQQPIPPYILDQAPRYYILGGLLLQELSGQYLRQWGGKWRNKAPRSLVYYYHRQWELFKPDERVVILTQVLPSRGVIGYEGLRFLRLTKINGRKIGRLEDVPKALSKPVAGLGGKGKFHRLEFDQNPRVIHIDAETLAAENKAIQQRYRLPALSRLTKPAKK